MGQVQKFKKKIIEGWPRATWGVSGVPAHLRKIPNRQTETLIIRPKSGMHNMLGIIHKLGGKASAAIIYGRSPKKIDISPYKHITQASDRSPSWQNRAMDSKLIIRDEKKKYSITDYGKKVLRKLNAGKLVELASMYESKKITEVVYGKTWYGSMDSDEPMVQDKKAYWQKFNQHLRRILGDDWRLDEFYVTSYGRTIQFVAILDDDDEWDEEHQDSEKVLTIHHNWQNASKSKPLTKVYWDDTDEDMDYDPVTWRMEVDDDPAEYAKEIVDGIIHEWQLEI